jgi:hypothetical protein
MGYPSCDRNGLRNSCPLLRCREFTSIRAAEFYAPNGVKDAGAYSVVWDGSNSIDATVASGIYFYKMDAKDFSQTRKMVMLR